MQNIVMATPRSILSHCSLLTTLNKSLRTTLESKFPLVSSVLLVRDQISYHIPRARLISQQIMYFWYKTVHFRFTPSPVLKLDCKTVLFFFFSKSVKKSVKRVVRVAREPHTLEGRVRRERKKTTVCFPYNEFVPNQRVQKCRRAVKNLFTTPPSMTLIHSVIDFEGE